MTIGREAVPIELDVFTTLLDNSVAGTYKAYEHAIQNGSISYSTLTYLAGKGKIPHALFFAPLPLVQRQVKEKTRKLLDGLNRPTFSIGSRATVELRDVELIVRDLIRKQQMLRKYDSSLQNNKVLGILRDDRSDIETDASRIMSAIGLTPAALRECSTKTKALDLVIQHLEANQVLVSRSVQHHMPQRLDHVKFSGMTIRDNKVPYIFLAGGNHGDDQEPVGRTVFTLALMTVLVARKIFAPMTWDGGTTETEFGREYDIAGAMLMPEELMRSLELTSIDDMKSVADIFHVTPSAATVRSMRLGAISRETASQHLEYLRQEFRSQPHNPGGRQILPETAIRKYNGRELTVRMLHVLDGGAISQVEFCRSVCLNIIRPTQIEDLRRSVT